MQSAPNREVDRLLGALQSLDKARDSDAWSRSLSPRKAQEAGFHNWVRDPNRDSVECHEAWEHTHSNMKFYATDAASAEHRHAWIKANAPGKIFLDYACGRGNLSLMAAEAGAALAIGLDISPVSIENNRGLARQRGITNVHFMVGDCEHTGLPDASVDRIIAAGCLHHLDLSYAFPEMRRILKPGGRVYAIEALAYNPFIQAYRRLTPHLRTDWEKDHILSLRELRFARRFFDVLNVRFFHLFSLAATPLRRTRAFPPVLRAMNALDRAVLRVPPFSYLAWQFTFELVKREER